MNFSNYFKIFLKDIVWQIYQTVYMCYGLLNNGYLLKVCHPRCVESKYNV